MLISCLELFNTNLSEPIPAHDVFMHYLFRFEGIFFLFLNKTWYSSSLNRCLKYQSWDDSKRNHQNLFGTLVLFIDQIKCVQVFIFLPYYLLKATGKRKMGENKEDNSQKNWCAFCSVWKTNDCKMLGKEKNKISWEIVVLLKNPPQKKPKQKPMVSHRRMMNKRWKITIV